MKLKIIEEWFEENGFGGFERYVKVINSEGKEVVLKLTIRTNEPYSILHNGYYPVKECENTK